ncbi:hypothetical protein [uncultured Microbacterium sp.]|uniref:hypothetical protein n=1 Tax=uncultured Microbacterium sp. TaxID=191216 RepID=UPI0035CBD100
MSMTVLRSMRTAIAGSGATARLAMTMPPSDYLQVALTVGLRVLTFGVLVGVWTSIPVAQLEASGTTLPAILTYTAVAQALGPLLAPRTTLADHIANGSIAVRLLWPMSTISQFVSEWAGLVLPNVALGVLGVGAAAWALGIDILPNGNIPIVILSILLAITVGIAVDFAFALLTVRLNNGIWFVNSIRAATTSLISGSLIPLSIMPWHIGEVLAALPFAAMAFAPLQVYVGAGDPVYWLLVQGSWALVLWVALFFWARSSRDDVVTAGG